ncbi:MAG: molybdenum cofactor biosynthesis protein MoaB [Candidatus Bathyarchaeota archaeon]|nr:molybdenum cofactor biosynthesis protein MoaB [Candidatus Bathyarchaeota archaeon]
MSDHHPRDQKKETVFSILITSDTRTEKTDRTGKLARELIEEAGHSILDFSIVPNDAEKISEWIEKAIVSDAGVIVTSGGTGIGVKDKTVDTASGLFEKTLPGFGEHFRRLSFEEVGLPGVWSRATAGVANGKLIFCLPGSKGAMRTALNKIILPGIGHMLWELNRK